MKAKTILDAEKKDAIDIATELCYSEEVKRKIAQAKSVYEFEQHEVPTIDYTTSVVNKVACDRVIYQKGESNVSKI